MKITVALIGNQNSGKTTLFNQLTGSSQHVGNFPGVTVEKKAGLVKQKFIRTPDDILDENISKKTKDTLEVEIVDLPGIYSLSPYTSEERVTRDFLIHEKPDAVINILDATNIERNMYLSLQLLEMNIPIVLALNMMDEVRAAGNSINVQKLASMIKTDVLPIAANKGEGVSELVSRIIESAVKQKIPEKIDMCSGPVHKAIHAIAHLIEEKAQKAGYPVRFTAAKLVEGDELVMKAVNLSENEYNILSHIVTDMEKELHTDREAALADMRYEFIARIAQAAVRRVGDTIEHTRSVKIDSVLTHRFLAIPLFISIMALIFYLTFGVIGGTLSGLFSQLIDYGTAAADKALFSLNLNPAVHSLVIDGMFAGVGSVLSFLPTILVLFFFLSLLEDSGYMARVAFVMDSLLRKIGLSGKSFVPMLIGFGCSVPAIMAARTLSSRRDKRLTVIITPFMSCSAKLPVYSLLCAAFFPGKEALVMTGLYIGGMFIAVLAALLLKNTIFSGKPVPFVMELPSYRMPSAKSMFINIKERARDFLTKAFTVIFFASIAIWFLQTFNFRFSMAEDPSQSMLAAVGRAAAPIFRPLGFDDWRLSTALITGLSAKEAVVSTLAVLSGVSASEGISALRTALTSMMSPAAALAYLVFILLYMPCIAALAVTKREIGTRHAIFAALFQTGAAWLAGAAVYAASSFFMNI